MVGQGICTAPVLVRIQIGAWGRFVNGKRLVSKTSAGGSSPPRPVYAPVAQLDRALDF